MNKLAYFIGKFSKKYRNWWMRKHATYPWGIVRFLKDFPPKQKLTMSQVQDFVLDKATYRDPIESMREITKLSKRSKK